MKYRPWIGFSLLGVSIAAEFLVPGQMRRTGLIFMGTLVLMLFWAQWEEE